MAKIPSKAFRNEARGLWGCWVVAFALTAALAGFAYFVGAGANGYAFAGVVGVGLLAVATYHTVQAADQSPKLIVGPEGIRDLRQNPPDVCNWDHCENVDGLVVTTRRPSGAVLMVTIELKVVLRGGHVEHVSINPDGLDARPEVILRFVLKVWERVKEYNAANRPPDESRPEGKSPEKKQQIVGNPKVRKRPRHDD